MLSSSERKGILIVAAIALAVTLAGIIVSRCGRRAPAATPADVELLFTPDSLEGAEGAATGRTAAPSRIRGDSGRWRRRDSIMDRRRGDSLHMKKKKKATRKSPKQYRRRSPLDEKVIFN